MPAARHAARARSSVVPVFAMLAAVERVMDDTPAHRPVVALDRHGRRSRTGIRCRRSRARSGRRAGACGPSGPSIVLVVPAVVVPARVVQDVEEVALDLPSHESVAGAVAVHDRKVPFALGVDPLGDGRANRRGRRRRDPRRRRGSPGAHRTRAERPASRRSCRVRGASGPRRDADRAAKLRRVDDRALRERVELLAVYHGVAFDRDSHLA